MLAAQHLLPAPYTARKQISSERAGQIRARRSTRRAGVTRQREEEEEAAAPRQRDKQAAAARATRKPEKTRGAARRRELAPASFICILSASLSAREKRVRACFSDSIPWVKPPSLFLARFLTRVYVVSLFFLLNGADASCARCCCFFCPARAVGYVIFKAPPAFRFCQLADYARSG